MGRPLCSTTAAAVSTLAMEHLGRELLQLLVISHRHAPRSHKNNADQANLLSAMYSGFLLLVLVLGDCNSSSKSMGL
jgi:hypothetical protein